MVARDRCSRARLVLSDELRIEIEELRNVSSITDEEKSLLSSCLEHKDVTVDELAAVVRLRKASAKKKAKLGNMTKGVVFPKEPELPPNPEMDKRREWLKAKQAAREYGGVIGDLGARPTDKQSVKQTTKVLNDFSVAIGMILLCFSVFYAAKFVCDVRGLHPTVGLVSGMLAGSAMLFIEMILFVIRATREESHKREVNRLVEENSIFNVSSLPQPNSKQKQ